MSMTFIAAIVFLSSFGGLFYMVAKKLPLLCALPQGEKEGLSTFLSQKVKTRIQNFEVSKLVTSPDLFLQKLLSKARIVSLKTEMKTNDWLVRLRQRSQEKGEKFSSNYWDKLKKK